MTEGATLGAAGRHGIIGRLARGSVLAFATYIAGAALTYLSQLLIARLTGATSYGYYAYALAWVTILAYVAALGFDVSLLRLIPGYCATRSWELAHGALRYAERRASATGLAIMLTAWLLLWWFRTALPGELVASLTIAFALVPIWSLLWLSSSAVRAFGGVISALAPDRVMRDGGLVVVLGLLMLRPGMKLDASGVMLVTVACSALGLIAVRIALHRLRPEAVTRARPEYLAASWRRTALPLVLISLAETLLNRTGILLLGWYGQTIAAGVYALAFNVSMTVTLPRTAINALSAPLVAQLRARGDLAALQLVVTRTALWTFLSGLLIALPLMIAADPLLSWFGPAFARGATAMRIVLVGQIVASAFGPQMFFMTMTGHERMAAVLLTGSALINGALGMLLIGSFGLTGAAIATTTALILWNAAMALFVWLVIRVVPGPVSLLRTRRSQAER